LSTILTGEPPAQQRQAVMLQLSQAQAQIRRWGAIRTEEVLVILSVLAAKLHGYGYH